MIFYKDEPNTTKEIFLNICSFIYIHYLKIFMKTYYRIDS